MVQASVPARSSRVLTSAVPIFEPPVLCFGRKTAFLGRRPKRIVSSAFSMVGAQADGKRHSQPFCEEIVLNMPLWSSDLEF